MKTLDDFLATLRAHGVKRYQGPTIAFGEAREVIVEFGDAVAPAEPARTAATGRAGGEPVNLDEDAPDLTKDPAEEIPPPSAGRRR